MTKQTKTTNFKFPEWFKEGLKKAKEKGPRNGAEIVMRATCKMEKIKIPKGFKFRSAYKSNK